MNNLTSEKSILFPEDSQEFSNLQCPSCGGDEFKVIHLIGQKGEKFIRIFCKNCREHLLFQTSYSSSVNKESEKDYDNNNLINISFLQKILINFSPFCPIK